MSISSAPSSQTNVEFAGACRCRHAGHVETAGLRHEAEIETCYARGGCMQHVEGVPIRVLALRDFIGQTGRHRQHTSSIGPRRGRSTNDDHWLLRLRKHGGERVLAGGDILERLRSSPKVGQHHR